MELQHPFRTISTSVDGDVLLVLASTHDVMTVGWLSNLIPARSPAGIRLTVERLVEQGVIRVHSVGRTRGYSLNDDHLLAPALRTIAGAQVAFIDRMQALFHPLPTPFAAVFGSAARGEMRADSDIDARRRRRGVG